MTGMGKADRALELRDEQRLLVKSETDIEAGWNRVREQEERLCHLQAGCHDTREAERLIVILRQTLVEWERHRDLIANRVSYLLNEIGRTSTSRDAPRGS